MFACFVDSNHIAYYGHTPVTGCDLTDEILRHCLKRIPDDGIFPEPPADVTIFSGSMTDDLYIKHPELTSWDEWQGQDFLARLFLGELECLELLQKHPHPHVASYYGCTVHRGRVTGLVLRRYPQRLHELLENGTCDLDTESLFQNIKSGVEHLHSLGLAHNDLNPYNIMLNHENHAVIIDFGSCKPFGARLQECGTDGWVDEPYYFSEKEHDKIALQKIDAWMKGKNEGVVADVQDSHTG